ncbi:MAG TPA: precorrin-3B synthase [Kineosporiaceae bacterium]|nr:precorrin-3B synthase [Kineosporiaceae bacterium]
MTGAVKGQGQRQRVDDGCPGALRPHYAADGALLRIRVPGGALALSALRGLAAAATEFADGRIGLTSRGNLQVRGVSEGDVESLVQRVRGAGLLPDAEHERVRNIVASPLSGRRSGSLDDVDPLVHDLDAALCARPGLARLPGRFLFAVDDGSGDVQAEGADVLALALGGGQYAVRPAGAGRGLQVEVQNVVAAMLAVAEAFLAERLAQDSNAWRIAELAGGGATLVERLHSSGWAIEHSAPGGQPALGGPVAPGEHLALGSAALEPGLIEQRDGRFAVCALTPLGLLTAAQVAALAAGSELSQAPPDGPRGALRITPWRRVVVRDLQLPAALAVRELLSSVDLVVEPGTAWSRLTACAGRPGCAQSLTDVHADVQAFAAVADSTGPALHWAGCERSCGTPSGSVVRVLATADGYRLHSNGGAQLGPRDLEAIRIEVAR